MTTGTALDPGTTHTAWVDFDTTKSGADFITGRGNCANGHLLEALSLSTKDVLVIERMAGFGRFGDEIIQTLIWSGRFMERFGADRTEFIYRSTVVSHVVPPPVGKKNKDGQVARAMQARFGGKGTMKEPGGTYGFDSHVYQALALAATYADKLANGGELPKKTKAKRTRATNHTTRAAKVPQTVSTTMRNTSKGGL